MSIETRTLAVLVDNEPGVLARVIGLFSGRGYNIESLSVATVDKAATLSRITIVTSGTPAVLEQIKAQLSRLIPVHVCHDLTTTAPLIARELVLVKVLNTGEQREKSQRIAEDFHAHIIDTTPDSFVFELTDSPEKITAFVNELLPLGLAEISRTGVAAVYRGTVVLG